MRELKKSEGWTNLGELKRKQKVLIGICVILAFIGGSAGMYAGIRFTEVKAEAEQVWQEHLERQEIENIKDNGVPVEETKKTDVQENSESKAESQVAPIKATAEDLSSAPASGIEKLIYETFGKDEYKTARAVAFAESRLNEKATNTNTNGTTDCGVFQINSIHGLEDCQNPVKNIEYAKKLFDRSGWSPWVAWKSGRYLAFL